MSIPTYNFEILAGNSGTVSNPNGIVFTLTDSEGAVQDLSGSIFVFTTTEYNGISLQKTSADGGIIIDIPTAKVTIPITVADSRILTGINSVCYEVEQQVGSTQRTRLKGDINVITGVNDD